MVDNKNAVPEKTLDQRMAEFLCSYHIGKEGLEASTKPFKYIMAKNGIFKVVDNKVGTFITEVKDVPGLPEITPGVTLKVPKVPYKMFTRTLAFFKAVMEHRDGAEAMVQFYYDKENKEYLMYCPQQEVGKGSVDFERNAELEEKYILVMDIHSHNSMGAFFSSIDDGDEKENRFYGVFGKLNTDKPEMKFRLSISGEYKELNIFDIFEEPEVDTTFPTEWLDKCKKPVPVTQLYPRTNYGIECGTKYGYWWENDKDDTNNSLCGDTVSGFEYDQESGCYIKKNLTETKINTGISTNVSSSVCNSAVTLAADVDIEHMSMNDRIDLMKDLLSLYVEDVAQAIMEEDALSELERYIQDAEIGREVRKYGLE